MRDISLSTVMAMAAAVTKGRKHSTAGLDRTGKDSRAISWKPSISFSPTSVSLEHIIYIEPHYQTLSLFELVLTLL